jgi:probable F420-dependent oxidoreductase
MKFGLFGINMGPLCNPDASARVAQTLEAAGFDSIWAGEHVVLPDPQVAPSPLPPAYPMMDPNVTFAFLAAETQSIRMGTGIIILPQRNPLVLAKEMATLDVLSKGRLIFGVGIGYLRAEFAALGIPFKEKAPRTIEYLEAMTAIWSEDAPVYDGAFVSFSGVKAHPRPVQQPHPPIVFGGHVPGAFERTATHGNGWYGFGLDIDAAGKCLEGLRAAVEKSDRLPRLGEIETSVTTVGNVDLDTARRFADLGVDRLVLLFPTKPDERIFSMTATEQDIVDYVGKVGDSIVGRV